MLEIVQRTIITVKALFVNPDNVIVQNNFKNIPNMIFLNVNKLNNLICTRIIKIKYYVVGFNIHSFQKEIML